MTENDTPQRPTRPRQAAADHRGITLVSALIALVVLSSCATTPDERFSRAVADAGLVPQVVGSGGFRLLLVPKPGRDTTGTLHVYLSGDGSPWTGPGAVAADPTPRNPVALRLMLEDPASALYLGRPCYHRLDASPPCSPQLWTSHRYGEQVVDAMARALVSHLETTPGHQRLALFGFSGGGSLAMLIARRLEAVTAVVTIAANLDTDGWTEHHAYSPLRGSINPALQPALPARVRQLHLVGGRDKTVPAALTAGAIAHQHGARLITFADYDHRCCWQSAWREILEVVESPQVRCPQSLTGIRNAACRLIMPGEPRRAVGSGVYTR